MATVLLVLVVVLVIAALVFGVVTLLSGDDPGLSTAEADSRALPLPNNRSLTEVDLKTVRFDVELRGYRMAQVDRVLRRTAYDVGYKDEMIAVLEAEVTALRDGRIEDAELLRKARESAASPAVAPTPGRHRTDGAGRDFADDDAVDELGDAGTDVYAEDDADEHAAGDDDGASDTERDDKDHHDTDKHDTERLDQDAEPELTEDPVREPTGDSDTPEEKATRG